MIGPPPRNLPSNGGDGGNGGPLAERGPDPGEAGGAKKGQSGSLGSGGGGGGGGGGDANMVGLPGLRGGKAAPGGEGGATGGGPGNRIVVDGGGGGGGFTLVASGSVFFSGTGYLGNGKSSVYGTFVNTGLFPDGLPRVYAFAEWVAMGSEDYILLAGAGGGGAGGDGQMVESEGARSRGGRSAASPAPSSGPKTPSPTPVLRIAAQEVTALLDLSASLDTSPYRQVRPSTLPAPSDSLVSVEPSSLDLLTARLDSGWDPVARAIADFTQAPTAPLDSLFGEELLLPQLLRGSF